MKLLCLGLIALALLVRASSYNLTGVWIGDWQNNYIVGTILSGANIAITEVNATALNVTDSIYNVSTTLNQTSETTWKNSKGDTLTYDPTVNTVSYLWKEVLNTSLLFENSSSSITQQLTMGFIGGTWMNPVQASNSANSSICCPPNSLFVTYQTVNYMPSNLVTPLATFTYSSSGCSPSNPGNLLFKPQTPAYGTITFGGYNASNSSDFGGYQIQITPLNFNSQLSLTYTSSGNSCSYLYSRSNQTNFISGSWVKDWQNTDNTFYGLTYQILAQSNLYMTSTLTYTNDNPSYGFVVQSADGSYFDYDLGANFTYSIGTNTLMIQDPYGGENILFSPNGSILSPTPLYSYWDNPQVSGSDCCTPYAVYITDSPSIGYLDISYYYSNASVNSLDCFGVFLFNNNTVQTGTISASIPNPNFLNLTDSSYAIYFANPGDYSELTLYDFANPSCSMTMQATTSLPPMPDSSNWISHQIVIFVAGLILMMF